MDWAIGQTGWNALCRRVGRNAVRSEPDDLLQAALLQVLERGHDGIANLEAYVLKAARNLAVDEYRRALRAPVAGSVDDHAELVACPAPLPDAVVFGREQLARLREALAALDASVRETFLLHRLEGLGYREIAQRSGVSVSAIEKRVAKALVHLTMALMEPVG